MYTSESVDQSQFQRLHVHAFAAKQTLLQKLKSVRETSPRSTIHILLDEVFTSDSHFREVEEGTTASEDYRMYGIMSQ